MNFEETSPTTLGTAVKTAIAIAIEGSKSLIVVVSTIGLSNIRVGSFDEVKDEADFKIIDKFYEIIGQFGKNYRVIVDIISITGKKRNFNSFGNLDEITRR